MRALLRAQNALLAPSPQASGPAPAPRAPPTPMAPRQAQLPARSARRARYRPLAPAAPLRAPFARQALCGRMRVRAAAPAQGALPLQQMAATARSAPQTPLRCQAAPSAPPASAALAVPAARKCAAQLASGQRLAAACAAAAPRAEPALPGPAAPQSACPAPRRPSPWATLPASPAPRASAAPQARGCAAHLGQWLVGRGALAGASPARATTAPPTTSAPMPPQQWPAHSTPLARRETLTLRRAWRAPRASSDPQPLFCWRKCPAPAPLDLSRPLQAPALSLSRALPQDSLCLHAHHFRLQRGV